MNLDTTDPDFYTRPTLRDIPAALHPDHAAVLLRVAARLRTDGHCTAPKVAPTWRDVDALVELRTRGLVRLVNRGRGPLAAYFVELTDDGRELAAAYERFDARTAS